LINAMKNIFALVDCNNFYVSCERVFNPNLEGKPVMVLSNNDGCVIARSNEVKSLGIKMGVPAFQCKDLIKKYDIKVYSSNYALYGDMSQRVMDTLARFTPELEIYSIDEAFLSLGGFISLNLTQYGKQIKTTVKKWTGIPVSIGLGPTKTLAKIANHIAKKDPQFEGVFDITHHPQSDELLDSIEVAEVWGIGYRYAQLLNQKGIYTTLQLKNAPEEWIKKYLTIRGLRTLQELRGISCIPLEQVAPPKKGITSSRSFGRPVETIKELREAVATYVSQAAEKLRAQKSAASCIHVFLTTNCFKDEPQYSNNATFRLPVPTSYTPELIHYAHQNLEKLFKSGYRYKKAGIMLTGIVPQEKVQLSLLTPSYPHARGKILMETIDRINARWGSNTVKYAAAGIQKPWKMRQTKKSPRFTTQWKDIPVVRTSPTHTLHSIIDFLSHLRHERRHVRAL